jgi:hypothetical protein
VVLVSALIGRYKVTARVYSTAKQRAEPTGSAESIEQCAIATGGQPSRPATGADKHNDIDADTKQHGSTDARLY